MQAATTKTFADNFDVVSYSNNDGTDSFAAPWSEYEPYATNDDPNGGYIRIRSNQLYFYWIYAETISRSLDLSGASSVTFEIELTSNGLSGDIQDIQMLNENNIWVTVLSVDENTPTGTLTYTLTPELIHANSAVRFVARDDWGRRDNVYWDNLVFTATYVDSDGDGVEDFNDLDDDNDGILDVDEKSSAQTDSFTNGNGGSYTNSYKFTNRSSITIDIDTLDTAFNVQIAGTTLLSNGNIMDTTNASGRTQLVFTTSGGGSGTTINDPAYANTNGLPRIRIFIDESGAVSIFGTRETTSTLLESLKTEDGTMFNTFVPFSGIKEITVSNPNDSGSSGLSGKIRVSINIDNDGDGIVNRLDQDSDDDSIPDNIEAQSTAGYILPSGGNANMTDANGNGLDDNYESSQGGTDLTPPDTDGDGIPDYFDRDSDDDRVTDCKEGMPDSTPGKKCPVEVGDAHTNGLVNWMLTSSVPYEQVNGVISVPVNDMFDFDTSTQEVSYREASVCGNLIWQMRAYQWKTIAAPCVINGTIRDIFSNILGGGSDANYGDNGTWVMYKQSDFSGNRNSGYTLVSLDEQMNPSSGYWIITSQDANVSVVDSQLSTSEAPRQPATNHIPATSPDFSEVYRTGTAVADATVQKFLLGHPFSGGLFLKDLFVTGDGGSTYYPMTDSANVDPFIYTTVYIYDSVGIDTQNYVAKTPGTPGFEGFIENGIGFWLGGKANSGATLGADFPYYVP